MRSNQNMRAFRTIGFFFSIIYIGQILGMSVLAFDHQAGMPAIIYRILRFPLFSLGTLIFSEDDHLWSVPVYMTITLLNAILWGILMSLLTLSIFRVSQNVFSQNVQKKIERYLSNLINKPTQNTQYHNILSTSLHLILKHKNIIKIIYLIMTICYFIITTGVLILCLIDIPHVQNAQSSEIFEAYTARQTRWRSIYHTLRSPILPFVDLFFDNDFSFFDSTLHTIFAPALYTMALIVNSMLNIGILLLSIIFVILLIKTAVAKMIRF